jgi:hypothetical protein
LSLPAAATTTVPLLLAYSMADARIAAAPVPPQLALTMSAPLSAA